MVNCKQNPVTVRPLYLAWCYGGSELEDRDLEAAASVNFVVKVLGGWFLQQREYLLGGRGFL